MKKVAFKKKKSKRDSAEEAASKPKEKVARSKEYLRSTETSRWASKKAHNLNPEPTTFPVVVLPSNSRRKMMNKKGPSVKMKQDTDCFTTYWSRDSSLLSAIPCLAKQSHRNMSSSSKMIRTARKESHSFSSVPICQITYRNLNNPSSMPVFYPQYVLPKTTFTSMNFKITNRIVNTATNILKISIYLNVKLSKIEEKGKIPHIEKVFIPLKQRDIESAPLIEGKLQKSIGRCSSS